MVRRLSDVLEIVGLSARFNEALLLAQAEEFGVPNESIECGMSPDLSRLARLPKADVVVVAVAGAVGTSATLAALESGKNVALATKEVLVSAGSIVMASARQNGANIYPIDSEHSAIFQCLQGQPDGSISQLVLTASGGPFKNLPREELDKVTLASALEHPTWPSMGKKITIDSSTLMNKALEIIEASWLFGLKEDRISVVIHPQSIIHSMVQTVDGSLLAQMGLPDMRHPIQYALTYPQRIDSGLPKLDPLMITEGLTFEKPDESRFPALGLARRALKQGGTMAAVMNASNEASVGNFISGKIQYNQICNLVEACMDAHVVAQNPSIDQIYSADTWAREYVNARASSSWFL